MPKRNGSYSAQNPKIDLYDSTGKYLCSTNWYATCRAALAAVKGAAKAYIDRS